MDKDRDADDEEAEPSEDGGEAEPTENDDGEPEPDGDGGEAEPSEDEMDENKE